MRSIIALTLFIGLSFSSLEAGAIEPAASGVSLQKPSTERSQSMKVHIRVGNQVLTATLLNNKTAHDFASLLTLTISMDDLFGREKYGSLPRPISEGSPRSSHYAVGDIGYWSPGPDVAIYYKQDGSAIPSPGIIPIGKIDSGLEVFDVPGSIQVTIELVK
jgi:hypothetical protein